MQKVALISGCSSGIGEDIALKLAKENWLVIAGVRKESDFQAIDSQHENIRPIYLDVTKEEHISACFQMFEKEGLRLDALVNNAGVGAGGPVEACEMQVWRKVYEVNVFGLVALTKKMLPLLRKTKGRIVNISSISGLVASPFMGVYASSKFAVEALSDSLRREVSAFGIEVSLIEPGPIKTKIWDKGIGESVAAMDSFSDEVKDAYGDRIDYFKELIENAVKEAVDVSETTKVIYDALTAKKPKTRYMVTSKKNMIKFLRTLPDRFADKLILEVRK